MPSHADGSASDLAPAIAAFIDGLRRFGKPVESVDENLSSHEAGALLRQQRASGKRGRISKEMVDAASAVLIAERWLRDAREPNGRENDRRLV
jgi:RNase H-fold protein (predicted Holliday junction resolvase)